MMYFKVGQGKFIQFDETTSVASVILKSDIVAQRDSLINVPPVPSNQVLLDWARINYPGIAQMGRDKEKIAELNNLLSILNAL